MNTPVTVEASTLEKTAAVIQNSARHLEKAAADQAAYATAVPSWVDAAVASGVIAPGSRDRQVDELLAGGIQKASEFVGLLIRHVGVRSLGEVTSEKAAGFTAGSGELSAHERFARAMAAD